MFAIKGYKWMITSLTTPAPHWTVPPINKLATIMVKGVGNNAITSLVTVSFLLLSNVINKKLYCV